MQAFKAANPGCVLEDFVRWHSPRDWMEERAEEIEAQPEAGRAEAGRAARGRLSARLDADDNLRTLLWGATSSLAASQQKPLFDPAREGADVLHRLDQIPPLVLLEKLVGLAVEAALCAVSASPVRLLEIAVHIVSWRSAHSLSARFTDGRRALLK